MKLLAPLLFFCILGLPLNGQILDRDLLENKPDSFIYVQADDLYSSSVDRFDTLDAFFHRYDPAKAKDFQHLHLGNLGSAATPALFDVPVVLGYDPGFHQYDLYSHGIQDYRFFSSDVAFTYLKYAQGLAQDDGIFNARFRRSFAKGAHISLDYLRINQIGQYAHQHAKHTGFGVGVYYNAPSGKYKGLFLYQSNSVVQEDNGGLFDYGLLDSADVPRSEPGLVYLLNANTVHRERLFRMEHHLPILRSAGDTLNREFNLTAMVRTDIGSGLYRFSDNRLDIEGSYFDGFIPDSRGVRVFVHHKKLANAFFLQADKVQGSNSDGAGFRLAAGLEHRYYDVSQEPEKRYLNELHFHGKGSFDLGKTLSLKAQGQLGFFDASENFLLQGEMLIKLEKIGTLRAEALFFQRQNSLIEDKLYVTQVLRWDNDFRNPYYQKLGLSWNIPKVNIEVQGVNYLLSNHIFYDGNKLPYQLSSTETVQQLTAKKLLTLGPHFGIYGWLGYQFQSVEDISLPDWIINAQVYYTGNWFNGNLKAKIGFDYGTTSDYGALGYFPLTGQFYRRDGEIQQYHALDFFSSFQVSTFRAFVKLENITSFITNDNFEQIDEYPQPEQYFRFGLNMRLYD